MHTEDDQTLTTVVTMSTPPTFPDNTGTYAMTITTTKGIVSLGTMWTYSENL